MAAPTRVLCVDDNPDVLAVLRMLIDSQTEMCCVGCLGSADGLIETVRRLSADVVLLDATMPGADPMVAITELAAAVPEARTIMFSGHDDAAFVDRAIGAGAWGCVSKGGEPTDILNAVRRVAAGHAFLS